MRSVVLGMPVYRHPGSLSRKISVPDDRQTEGLDQGSFQQRDTASAPGNKDARMMYRPSVSVKHPCEEQSTTKYQIFIDKQINIF
jgi:hypothetical protein